MDPTASAAHRQASGHPTAQQAFGLREFLARDLADLAGIGPHGLPWDEVPAEIRRRYYRQASRALMSLTDWLCLPAGTDLDAELRRHWPALDRDDPSAWWNEPMPDARPVPDQAPPSTTTRPTTQGDDHGPVETQR